MNGIVEDFLNVSRIDQGRLKFTFEEVDLVSLVKGVVQEQIPQAEEKGLELTFDSSKPEFQVKADTAKMEHTFPLNFSHETDYRLPLRYTGLLSGNIDADICANTGIYNAETVIKMILAGASAVQIVSALYRHGTDLVGDMLQGLESWMDEKGFARLVDFRGKLAKSESHDPWAYTRAQYVKLLLEPREIFDNAPAI